MSDTELLGAGVNGSRSYAAAKPTATPPTISATTAATISSTRPVRTGGRGTMTVGGSGGRTDWAQVGGCTGALIEAIMLAIDSFIAALSDDEFAAMVQRTRGTL